MEIQGRSRLIDFLMVLNPKRFNGIIGSILAMEPLSTVSRAFHLVQQAEKQKEIVEGVNSLNTIEMSALSVTKQGGQGGHKRETKREKYSKQCEFCGMRGHVKDDCFKIYGYPEWFKNLKGKSKGKMVANVNKYAEESEPDTPLEFRDSDVGSTSNTGKGDTSLISNVVQKVIKALNDKQAGNNHTCNFAGILTASNVESMNCDNEINLWIVDFGASDHMVGNRDILIDIKILKKTYRGWITRGSMKKVEEMGNAKFPMGLKLENVLVLPDFKHNLLSVGKVLESKDFEIVFDSEKCYFKDR
ncbi:Zinc finger CCHC domain-containing protein 18 [Bienertia sinuspersici]